MISPELKNIVESIIFASDEEIGTREIKSIIEKGGLRISPSEVDQAVELLNEDYKTSNKSFEILKIAGGYSFATKKEYGRFIGNLFEDKQKKRLSPSALETLAIIAYKQPITRSEIEFIRGVNVDYIVNSLLEKEMVTIQGRAETPGRPILYATTKNFLKVLGLNTIEDLPKLKEINEILKNQEIEGITEADIELFNSVNNPEAYKESDGHQLELISNSDEEAGGQEENEVEEVPSADDLNFINDEQSNIDEQETPEVNDQIISEPENEEINEVVEETENTRDEDDDDDDDDEDGDEEEEDDDDDDEDYDDDDDDNDDEEDESDDHEHDDDDNEDSDHKNEIDNSNNSLSDNAKENDERENLNG